MLTPSMLTEKIDNMRSYFYATRHNFMKEMRITEEGCAANGSAIDRLERVYGSVLELVFFPSRQ
jgi:hypothetical protein